MIYITGDTHGYQERFDSLMHNGIEKLTSEDILIICGDFGFIFSNDAQENYFLDLLSKKPYTICFIDGNHENFPAIYSYPIEVWNGGKTHHIRNNIYHLMRGQVFTIDGKTFFTMGGAYSIDRYMRIENESFWREELPNEEEYKEAVNNLHKCAMRVDYILTHTMPREMILHYGKYPDAHDMELTGFLEWILYEVKYKHWYCGHWHDDKKISDKFTVLWFDVIKVE